MTLNEFCKQCFDASVKAGWMEPGTEPSKLEAHMLVVTELAEASESVRNGEPDLWVGFGPERLAINAKNSVGEIPDAVGSLKPEGEAAELMDAFIRLAVIFGRFGWDADAIAVAKLKYNATRGHRHGNKVL